MTGGASFASGWRAGELNVADKISNLWGGDAELHAQREEAWAGMEGTTMEAWSNGLAYTGIGAIGSATVLEAGATWGLTRLGAATLAEVPAQAGMEATRWIATIGGATGTAVAEEAESSGPAAAESGLPGSAAEKLFDSVQADLEARPLSDFAVQPNKALFYSGAKSAEASEYAKSNGLETMVETAAGKWLSKLDLSSLSREQTAVIWRGASLRYAQAAQGNVNFLFGADPDPEGIFNIVELSTLTKNADAALPTGFDAGLFQLSLKP